MTFFWYFSLTFLNNIPNTLIYALQVKMAEWHRVCWLSLQKAVATIIKTYGPLVTTLDHEASDNAVAKGIHSFIGQPIFLLNAALLLDVINIIDPLKGQFQAANTTSACVTLLVSTAIKVTENITHRM